MYGKSKIKNFCVLFLVLLLFACSDEPSVTRNSEANNLDPDFGWRKGDFIPVLHDSKMYGGLKSIYHVGERIVLVDNYWSSNQYTSPGSVTYTPRVFASKIGSTHWDTLSSSEWIRYVYGDSTGLYAGTQLSGKVLKYDAEAAVDLLYRQRQRFDLIFVDPPYNKGWVQKILSKLAKFPLLAENGWLVAEHSAHDDITGAVPEGYEIFRSQQYGETVLSFIKRSF